MSFQDRFNQQRRDAEKVQRDYDAKLRRDAVENEAQLKNNFEQWFKNALLPVWRNWERLDVGGKIQFAGKRYPNQSFSLSIHGIGGSTPSTGRSGRGYSWGEISEGKERSQKHRFRLDDFTSDKIPVYPPISALTTLTVTAEAEGYNQNDSYYYKYVCVSLNQNGISLSGSIDRLDPGVSIREFDDALLKAIANPSESRRRDPA